MKVQYPFVQGPRIVGGELPLAEMASWAVRVRWLAARR